MLDTKKLKAELSEMFSTYCREYQNALNDSFSKKIRELNPGERTPEKSLFYDEDVDHFSDVAKKYRASAQALIESALKEIRTKKTDAPSTDAVNFLNVFSTKKEIGEDDILEAVDRYGDNYVVYNSLHDLAMEHRISTIPEHILDRIENGLVNVMSTVNRMNLQEARDGHATPAYSSVFDLNLNMNLPDAVIV